MTEKEYGEFQTANDHLGDVRLLDSIFNRQGYLFFRGVLDTQQVLEVKGDFVRELGRQGFVEPGGPEPIWTAKSLEELDEAVVIEMMAGPSRAGRGLRSRLLSQATGQRRDPRVLRAPFRRASVHLPLLHHPLHGPKRRETRLSAPPGPLLHQPHYGLSYDVGPVDGYRPGIGRPCSGRSCVA